jgi:hypothetical protein
MISVALEITAPPRIETVGEIQFIADVDALSSTEVMFGCGNDNPY